MAKGILGTTSFDDFVKQQLLDWKRIEKIAKQNGIYTAADLAKLIQEQFPNKIYWRFKDAMGKKNLQRRNKKIKNLCIKSKR